MAVVARWVKKCPANCGTRIEVGDSIAFDEELEEWVHETCAIETRSVERVNPVCPKCFMEKAASGACGCG